MKSKFLLILFSVVALFSYSHAQSVVLDPAFDGDGIAIFQPGTVHDVANGVIVLSDTTSIICGTANLSGSTAGIVMRILEDGTQDTEFATGGVGELQYGTSTYAYNIELLSDGKFLVSGIFYPTPTNADMFVARFLSDGTPDVSFGVSGVAVTDYSDSPDCCYAMAVQDDGGIILAGRTKSVNIPFSAQLFTRFTVDGTLDTTFGTSGYTVIDGSIQDERINSLGLLSDGTIVGMGDGYLSTPHFGHLALMAKLDASGTPVPGFGTGGVLFPPIFDDCSKIYDLQVENDTLYTTGYMYDAVNDHVIFIAKLDSQGNAVTAFGTEGITFTKQSADDHINVGYDVLLAPDDKIYVCGTSGFSTMFNPRDFILLRYTSDGILDPSFNSIGYIVTSIGPLFEEANAMGIQPDGKVLLAGFGALDSKALSNDIILTRYLVDQTSIEEQHSPVTDCFMLQSSPNPFNSTATISFSLSSPELVTLEIVDVAGRKIETLIDNAQTSGSQTFVFNGEHLANGIYFCRLQVGAEAVQTEMMTFLR